MKVIGKIKNYIRGLLTKKPFEENGFTYSKVEPFAEYSPWLSDKEFQESYEKAKNLTLVDVFRLYELWETTKQLKFFPHNCSVIEIGTWRGGSALIINESLKSSGQKNRSFFVCDTFSGVKKTSEKDSYYFGDEHNETSEELVKGLFKNDPNVKILKGLFPEDSGQKIDSNAQFCLVHIDVDVYLSCRDIISFLKDRILPSGVIIIDDYGFKTCNGITQLINDLKETNDFWVFHNLNGHALLIKR